VSIPVIASGGAGSLPHVADVLKEGKADAVALASMLHYRVFREADKSLPVFTEGNTDFFETGDGYSRVTQMTVGELKSYLIGQRIMERELVLR
jgi:cyclase